jgi:hypothetical protein
MYIGMATPTITIKNKTIRTRKGINTFKYLFSIKL